MESLDRKKEEERDQLEMIRVAQSRSRDQWNNETLENKFDC